MAARPWPFLFRAKMKRIRKVLWVIFIGLGSLFKGVDLVIFVLINTIDNKFYVMQGC